MDVAACVHVRAVIPDHSLHVGAVGVGENNVLVRRGRAVEAEEMSAAVELNPHRRLEAAQDVEPFATELFLRPAANRKEARQLLLVQVARLRRAWIEGEEKLVRVAEDAAAAELTQSVDALRRLRPALRDVAEADDLVERLGAELCEHRVEPDGV